MRGSLGRLFSCSEAKRGPEPRRPEAKKGGGEVEDVEEVESERVVLGSTWGSMLAVDDDILFCGGGRESGL